MGWLSSLDSDWGPGGIGRAQEEGPSLRRARTAARGTGPLRVRDPGRWNGVGGRGPAAAHLPNVSAAVGVQQVYKHPLDPDNFLRPGHILFFGHGGAALVATGKASLWLPRRRGQGLRTAGPKPRPGGGA